MRYNVVSYRELPSRLRINGLPCRCKPGARYGPRPGKLFSRMVWDYNYVCYGKRPRAEELHDCGPWLMDTDPFFVEVEKPVFEQWTGRREVLADGKIEVQLDEEGEVLPKEIAINDRKLIRAFDRYYFAHDPNEKEIEFVFDYMAPTYEADIHLKMNLDVNRRLLESIAGFDLPETVEGKPVQILDYGVGTGICADALPDPHEEKYDNWGIVGVDISRQMVRRAREKRREEDPTSLLLDAYEIRDGVSPLPDSSFDAAMACFAVQYFLDRKPYQEIHRLLRVGAPFVCNALQDEINRVESCADDAGLTPQRNRRQQLDWEVKKQPVMLLAFTKKHP